MKEEMLHRLKFKKMFDLVRQIMQKEFGIFK